MQLNPVKEQLTLIRTANGGWIVVKSDTDALYTKSHQLAAALGSTEDLCTWLDALDFVVVETPKPVVTRAVTPFSTDDGDEE